MSDGALSREEINAILLPIRKMDFEEKKALILKEIEELGVHDIDIVPIGDVLTLDAIEAVLRTVRENKKTLDRNAGEI